MRLRVYTVWCILEYITRFLAQPCTLPALSSVQPMTRERQDMVRPSRAEHKVRLT
jgi:hypothetical protein